MILFELVNGEQDPRYKTLEIENGNRHYDFLHSIVTAALGVQRPFLSSTVIKALNFHAIACLHPHAGDYRPCPVEVGTHTPPAHWRVPALMDDMVNVVNRSWEKSDPVALATFVLWRMNWVHPFINGNGRTSRAACYFVLCVAAGGWLPGTHILPELIRRERAKHIELLKKADEGDLKPLHDLLSELLKEQLASAQQPGGGEAAPGAAAAQPPAGA